MSADVNQQTADVLIIGNGALGLALGIELAKRGKSVAIVGPADRAYAASKAAGAMNGCFGEITKSTLETPYGRAKLELDIAASRVWGDWSREIADLAGTSAGSLRRETGTIVIFNAIGVGPLDSANFAAIKAGLEHYNEPYSEMGEDDIPWIQPQESSRSFRGLSIPGEHCVETAAYLAALDTAFVKLGGRLVNGWVQSLALDAGTRSGFAVLKDGDRIAAQKIVLAAGAHSHDLLSQAGIEAASKVPPMLSGCGTSILVRDAMIRPVREVIRTPNRSFACGLHIVPRKNNMYVGATNIMNNAPRMHTALSEFHFLLECAIKQLHTELGTARIESIQVGNRPIPIDGAPLIGQIEDTCLWMMTGTYRDGFHQSPVLCRKVADALLDGSGAADLALFQPARAPFEAASRDQVVASTVDHMISSGFESDWRIPPKWSSRIKADLHEKYARVAEALHPHFTPPPEVLAFCSENPMLTKKLRSYYEAYA